MINPGKTFNIHDYVEIVLRRIWYIIIPFVVIGTAAVLYAFYAPKEYRATTLILVTPQKIPETFVKPTVTSKIEDRLQSISQEIMSRTRLEQIVSEFKLYQEEAKSLSLEEIVELMRKNIRVEIKGKEGAYLGYFTISYQGRDPKTVTLVTNKLASLFIEENLKFREQQAQGTSEFLSIELNATKAKLEEQEKAITKYKKQFMGELPEQREANLKVLEQLQLLYQRIGENLRAAQDRKLILQKRLSDFELLMTSPSNPENLKEEKAFSEDSSNLSTPLSSSSPKTKMNNSYGLQLEQLRNHLIEIQAKYTEKHPDIVITKKKIADLEAKIKNSESNKSETGRKEKINVKLYPNYKEMESQLIVTNLEIERLRKEEVKVEAQINKYRERIENSTSREQDMALLTRDYQNTKEAYESLLKKSREAQQAENLERRQKGEQFKVIDPARVPEKPFKPDIPKILLFGFLLGLGGCFGMAFFREQMDHSFRDAEDLETTLGFKVLANIPKIEKKIEKKAA